MNRNVNTLVLFLVIIAVSEFFIIHRLRNVEGRITPLYSFNFYNGATKDGFADDYVSAKGTWKSTTALAYPINSSEIICLRDSNTCVESRGEVSDDGYLMVNSFVFDIVKWNTQEIVTKPQDSGLGCTQLVMRFDRIKEQVTETRTTIKNTEECAGVSIEPMYLTLGDPL